jgi:CRP-like cAMP-binding protein
MELNDDLNPLNARNAAELAEYLGRLHLNAGSPTGRAVEELTGTGQGYLPHTKLLRTGVGRTNLGLILSGKKFPKKAVFLTVVEALGVDLNLDRRWELAWIQVANDLDGSRASATPASSTEEATSPATDPAESPRSMDVAIISCDIAGHSATDSSTQLRRFEGIKRIVATAIHDYGANRVTWLSGGDGGHLVVTGDVWRKPAIAFITALRTWAREERVRLRITAHYGPVFPTLGHDGGNQFVGDGINMAGWTLSIGSPQGVVVSDAFKQAYESLHAAGDVMFHEKRTLRHKSLDTQDLWLASFDEARSRWSLPVEEDRERLKKAQEGTSGWAVIHSVKRIMQINPNDSEAVEAIHELTPSNLTYISGYHGNKPVANPFLGYFSADVLREVIQLGELIERGPNEVICRYGDKGDTMFVILSGQVGVYRTEGRGSSNPAEPGYIMSEGEIVGELAFALGRARTADLVTLAQTALLSFNMAEISKHLANGHTLEMIESYIRSRAVEHTCDSVPYLLGSDRTGPLAAGDTSWRAAVRSLVKGSRLLTLDPADFHLSLARVEEPDHPQETGGGIYILVSGEVSATNSDSRLQGAAFPLLWVDLPGTRLHTATAYKIKAGPAKILHFRGDSIAHLEFAKRAALHDSLNTHPRA